MKRLDVKSGDVFSRLTVLQEITDKKRRYFSCECSCGAVKEVMLKHLVSGATQSCGCLQVDVGKGNKEHLRRIAPSPRLGKRMTAFYEHGSYRSMLMRCLDTKHKGYPRWGGRGITVCARWLGRDGFKNFLVDMGERPPRYSIERIDNNGNYNKENCKWASFKEQANNTSWTNTKT